MIAHTDPFLHHRKLYLPLHRTTMSEIPVKNKVAIITGASSGSVFQAIIKEKNNDKFF